MKLNQHLEQLNTEEASRKLEASKDWSMNLENVDYQTNMKFVTEAQELVYNILQDARKSNKNIPASSIKDLEKLFTNQFGIRVKFTYNNIYNAFTIPFLLDRTNGGFVNFKDGIRDAKKMLDKGKTKANRHDEEKFDNRLKDEIAESYDPYNTNTFKALDDATKNIMIHLLNSNLKMDVKNAKILNAPKEAMWYASIDFHNLGGKATMDNARNVLAIIMHEIGHCWTYFEYAYNVFSDIKILGEVLREEYSKKNKTPTEVVAIYYQKSGIQNDGEKYDNISYATIAAVNKTVTGKYLGDGSYSRTNWEQQADEFAARFGLGCGGVMGLQELYNKCGVDPTSSDSSALYALSITMFGLSIVGTVVSSVVLLAPVLFLTGFFWLIAIVAVIGSITFYSKDSEGPEYDDIVRRYQRIKNATIRFLAAVEDKEVKTRLVADVEAIEKTIDNLKDNKPILHKIGDAIYKRGRGYKEVVETELMEDLMTNDFTFLSSKMSTLKGVRV